MVDKASMTVTELGGWLVLTAAVSAFVGWGVTELLKREVFQPWKIELRRLGLRFGWWWSAVVGGISMLMGACAGAVMGCHTPIHSIPVGLLVGIGAGAAPAAIIGLLRRRAARALGAQSD